LKNKLPRWTPSIDPRPQSNPSPPKTSLTESETETRLHPIRFPQI
jgi:hypothetical protein